MKQVYVSAVRIGSCQINYKSWMAEGIRTRKKQKYKKSRGREVSGARTIVLWVCAKYSDLQILHLAMLPYFFHTLGALRGALMLFSFSDHFLYCTYSMTYFNRFISLFL